jgi:hypothetical protein
MDFVGSTQLSYWNYLLETLEKEMPDFVFAMRFQFFFDPNSVSPQQWILLNVLLNNVFVKQPGGASDNNDDSVYKVPIQSLVQSSTYECKLCSHHAVKQLLSMNLKVIVLDYPLLNEVLPSEIHPVLWQCLMWFQSQPPRIPILRLFGMSLLHSEKEEVTLTPLLMEDYNQSLQLHLQYFNTLNFARIDHITCKFCFPSEIGACAHSIEKKYFTTIQNCPFALNQVKSMDEEVFRGRQERLKGFLLQKSQQYSSPACFVYRKYVTKLWQRIYKQAFERFGTKTNFLIVVAQFDRKLTHVSTIVAENFVVQQKL